MFRAEAAFAKPEIYEALDRRVKYAIRIPANESLERDISELLVAACGATEPQVCAGCKVKSSFVPCSRSPEALSFGRERVGVGKMKV